MHPRVLAELGGGNALRGIAREAGAEQMLEFWAEVERQPRVDQLPGANPLDAVNLGTRVTRLPGTAVQRCPYVENDGRPRPTARGAVAARTRSQTWSVPKG